MIAAFALTMVGSAFAQEKQSQPWTPMTQTPALEGYVYTATQRVKIIGENIVTNGAFESKEGWTNAAGEDLNAAVWEISAGEGPGGENAIKSLSNTTADAALCKAWTLSAGTYVVMYDIKGAATTVTGIVNGNTSCLDFFLTSGESLTKGTEGDVQVATVNGFKEDWKTVAYYFEAADGQKLVMHAEKLNADAMITNIRILPVNLVYDDRVLKEKLAYVDKLIATEKFTLDTENGFIENVVSVMKGMLDDPSALDDISGAQGLIDAYEGELKLWYDLNAADLLKNEKRWSAYGDTRNKNGIGGNWQGTGGRWFHINNGGSNEITNDGDEIGLRHQGGVEAASGSQYYTITPANPGTYMFSLDIVGHYMAGTSGKSKTYTDASTDNYITDWNRDFKGVTMYAGKDIMGADAEANAAMNNEQEGQKIDCGYINNPNAKNNPQKFVVFYEVSQEMVDAKTPVTFGITYIPDPDRQGGKLGRNVNIANPQIRLIGVTQEAIDYQNEVKAIITQQGPLKERLGWANDDMAKTAADGYPWGKAALKEAIDKYQPVYDASLTVVDAEGNVLNEAFIKEQMKAAALGEGILYSDNLLNSVNAMNSARSAFASTNSLPAVTYLQKVADAEAVYADDFYGAGDKVTFRTAIDAAIAKRTEILATTTDETRDADIETLNTQLNTLAEAVEAFKASASNLPIIDIDFANAFEATEEGHKIAGTKGEMNFTNANPENNNVDKEMTYAKGCGEEHLDVLRVGSAEAWVNIAEADQPGEGDIIRFEFDMWSNRLSGKSIIIELRNADNQRVAGLKYDPYDNATGYNDFDDAANEGLTLNLNTSWMAGTAGDVATLVDAYKTHFTLLVDRKAVAASGTTVTTKGTFGGKLIPLRKDLGDGTDTQEATPLTDTKIAKFVLNSDYGTYQGRRCWFDNLQAFKYASQAEGPITAIETVETVKANDGAIYNLAGQKVSKSFKGLIIKNGKKYFVK